MVENGSENPKLASMEIEKECGISVVPKSIFENEESESCSWISNSEGQKAEERLENSKLVVKVNSDDRFQPINSQISSDGIEMSAANQEHNNLFEERQSHFANGNKRDQQECTNVKEGGGRLDNTICMNNLDGAVNMLTKNGLAFELNNQNNADMASDTATTIVKDVSCELLSEAFSFETKNSEEHCTSSNHGDVLSAKEPVQHLFGKVLNLDLERNITKESKTSEDTANLVGKKTKLRKLIDSHASETEKAISVNLLVDFRDSHLGNSRLGCLAATSQGNISKNIEASRTLRRSSLLLIPPHGANRHSSSSVSRGSNRTLCPVISHRANRFLSVSSTGGSNKFQTYKEQQVGYGNNSKENSIPMVEESSKAADVSHLQNGVQQNKLCHEETEFVIENTMAVEETVVGDALIEMEAKQGPAPNHFDQKDAQMIDSDMFYVPYRNSNLELKEPKVFQNKMEVQHNKHKEIQRVMQTQANKGTHLSNLIGGLETKQQIFSSRYKNEYKKSLTRKLRNSNNLARISTMRQDILAGRRSSTSTAKDGHIEANSRTNQLKTKSSGYPFSIFGRKHFLVKALAESAKQLQVQKMLRPGVYDRFAVPKKDTEVHSKKIDESSEELNQTALNIVERENKLYDERMIQQQRRRQEQFKKSLLGKSREKAMKIAKTISFCHRTQILQSRRGNRSTSPSNTSFKGNSDGPLRYIQ